VDIVGERLALATKLGADVVINSAKQDVIKAIYELTAGLGADAACETSGSAMAQANLVDALKYGGKGVFVGFGAQGPSITVSSFIGKQLVLMGSFVMPINYYWDLTEFMVQHGISGKFKQMITHRFTLHDAVEAFKVADAAKSGKVVFNWS
jgi:threonine dehydrogenase-like Zn-dependent dehydrogenase